VKKKYSSEWSIKKPLWLKKTDKGYRKHLTQLKNWGFSDSETWALGVVIAKFALPRLERFKEVANGYPEDLTWKQWQGILNKIIFAFEKIAKNETEESETVTARIEEGLSLFGKYFRHLWW